ncbi:MAG: glycosyltransferase family 2 protein [Sediminibacterium sp.]
MELSVIIVNYCVPDFLEQCLITVKNAMQQLNGEIIVVDNASPDDSITKLAPLFPDVHFLQAENNIGFGRACNLGLSKAKGNYILFLNPDTLVPENTIAYCVSFLNNHQQTGAVGVKMINGFGNFLPESKRAKPSLSNTFFKVTGMASLFPASGLFNNYALGQLSKNENHRIDVLAGAFMMVRKALLESMKGFDPVFFMYGEDIDLSLRISKLGYDIYYLGEVSIIHYKGQSSRNRSGKQHALFYKAMRQFVHKHYKAGWLLIPFIFFVQGLSLIKQWLLPKDNMLTLLNKPGTACMMAGQFGCEQIINVLTEKGHSDILKQTALVLQQDGRKVDLISGLASVISQQQLSQVLVYVPDYALEEIIPAMEGSKNVFFRFLFAVSRALPFNK